MAYSTTQPLCEFECLSGPASLFLRRCETPHFPCALYIVCNRARLGLPVDRVWPRGFRDGVLACSSLRCTKFPNHSHLGVHTSFSPKTLLPAFDDVAPVMMPLFLCGAASALFLLRSTLQTPPPLLQSAHPVSRPLMLCGSVVKAVTFAETGLCRSMLRAAQQQQWLTPTSVQSEAIPAILSGSDVWAQAPTGSGKTAAFALPLLQRLDTGAPRPRGRHVNTLILSPTRELAVQTSEAFRALSDSAGTRAKIVALHGGVSINPQLRSLAGGADVVVV